MYDWLFGPFIDFEFMRRALAGSVALALGAGPVGVFLMLRRMSLVGDAMAHAILPGAAIGFLVAGLNLFAMTAGGFIAGCVVALLTGLVARLTELKEDAALASFYILSLALGVTIVSLKGTNIDLLHVLFGIRARARQSDAPADRRQCDDHAHRAGADLPAAGDRMRRPGLPALGQPRRRAGASRLPRAGGDQPGPRLPGARHAARGRHDDAAGGDQPLLGARHHADDRDRDRQRRRRPAMRVCCSRSTPACRRARDHPRRRCSLRRCRCCSGASAVSFANGGRGVISKRERGREGGPRICQTHARSLLVTGACAPVVASVGLAQERLQRGGDASPSSPTS